MHWLYKGQCLANTRNTVTADLTACGNSVSQYINYTIGGSNYAFSVPADSITYSRGNGYTNFSAMSQSPYRYLYLSMNTTATVPGTYPINYFEIFDAGNSTDLIKQGTLDASITQYGSVNGYIIGSFTGTLKDSIGTGTYPISCNFKIKRTLFNKIC